MSSSDDKAYIRHRKSLAKLGIGLQLTGELFKEYLMGKAKINKACYVFMRPKKKNKWGVFNRVTNSEFLFKKKRHAYLVADCLNQIYTIELVDIPKTNK